MKDGFTTAGGLGLGLSGAAVVERLRHRIRPRKGDTVIITRWR